MKYLIKKWFMEKKKIMALLLVFIEVMVIVCIFGILFKVDHVTKQMEKMNDNLDKLNKELVLTNQFLYN